jgi:hypothetical protein
LGQQAVESTDSDSEESSQEESPRLSAIGKNFIYLNSIDLSLEQACLPLTSMLVLTAGKFRLFDFDVKFGLQGTDTLRTYPCVLDEQTQTFFVWLGDTDIKAFTKHTFLNLCDFAETQGALHVIFLVDRQHKQKTEYKRMFKVIDAVRLSEGAFSAFVKKASDGKSDLVESEKSSDSGVSFVDVDTVAFYKFAL